MTVRVTTENISIRVVWLSGENSLAETGTLNTITTSNTGLSLVIMELILFISDHSILYIIALLSTRRFSVNFFDLFNDSTCLGGYFGGPFLEPSFWKP